MKAGDKIRVITEDEEIEGILLPAPEMLDSEVLILKLHHGYNIGINKSKIKSTEVIEKYEADKPVHQAVPINKNLPHVTILSFGGTISSKIDYRTGGVSADYDANDFLQMCPELNSIANITAVSAAKMMSEDMGPDDWLMMAKKICDEVNKEDVSGVVVTQGTDTLHFSTAAMSFLLNNLTKPVVFTASQRSIDRGSTDAFMNLICSVKTAAEWDGAEVVTCMHGSSNDDYCILIRGTKVRKMHTSRRDTFRPINEQPFAQVTAEKITVVNSQYAKRSVGEVVCKGQFEQHIAFITAHPGFDPGVIDYYVNKGVKGIVFAATGLGHLAVHGKNSVVDALQRAKEKDVPIIVAAGTLYGRVNPFVYTNLRTLSVQLDCIFVEDMLPETAYVKLGCVLPLAKDNAEVKELMQKNLTGEMNDIINDTSFLN